MLFVLLQLSCQVIVIIVTSMSLSIVARSQISLTYVRSICSLAAIVTYTGRLKIVKFCQEVCRDFTRSSRVPPLGHGPGIRRGAMHGAARHGAAHKDKLSLNLY